MRISAAIMTTIAASLISDASAQLPLVYPTAPSDNTTDNYFGTVVADKFRPLENDTAAATLEWVRAENKVTDDYLSQIPFRQFLRKRLTELNNYKKTGLPSRENDGRYYYYVNDGLQNQSVLYRVAKPAHVLNSSSIRTLFRPTERLR